MRADRAYVCAAALGHLGDLLLGDPRRGHPVAVFGGAAAAAEGALWRDHRAAGALHTALCAGGAAAAVTALGRTVRALAGARGATLFDAAVTWTVLGGTGLREEALAVAAALETDDVAGARRLLPNLCGRDPEALDADAIARAVVESVAENTSDAVVGALVWGAAAGAPGMAAFRAVNTLDAMFGHRSPRHLRFGWAAARLDDAAGWPGARLTAVLAALAGPSPRGALRTWRADARSHPSPNAGPVEAAFAGALGVRLGGTLSYAGRTEHRPVLNSRGRAVRTDDIVEAVRLSRRVGLLALLITSAAGALRIRRAPVGEPVGEPVREPEGEKA
ncbi:cobalamin biosynthesis protein [Streptomyces sp. HNM0575]|uniref:cobalamin biosynthesis protein n=1 Tax=Streptomyces sp. HNM0575 TaxID=2716338 RepID=UPI00145DDDA0|nr:cobalamin biosynthesis protein [Streptomyces sp. HNM0575]NLU74767.1 cobalamin biosynthesis protein [Streptomyces sp. HNM0575]